MKRIKRSVLKYAVAAVMLALLILFLNRKSEPFSYLEQKASELGNDSARIITFVTDEIDFEDYQGGFRGAIGTLWGGAGNELDQSILLNALLRYSQVESKIMTREDRFWVQVSETGEQIFPAGQPLEQKGKKDSEVNLSNNFTIEFISDGGDSTAPVSFSGRVSEFLRHPLQISVTENVVTLLREGEPILSTPIASANRLRCRFTFHFPDGSSKIVRRELFRSKAGGAPSNSEHFVTFAPGQLPKWAYEKQTSLLRTDLQSGQEARAYELTIAHWHRSDLALSDISEFFSAPAFCAVPRILIGSVYKTSSDESAAGYALDLRLNGVHIIGSEKVQSDFAIARSVLEAELEAKVMESAFDMPARSGIEVFLNHMHYVSPSSAKRVSDYLATLDSFVADSVIGERLRLSVGEGGQWVELVRSKNSEILGVKLSRDLERSRRKLKQLPWNALRGKTVAPEGFEELAWELEALLGSVSDDGVSYVPLVEILDGGELVITPNVRKFTYRTEEDTGKKTVSFETQFREIREDGSYTYEVVDHWSEVKKEKQLLQRNYTVSASCAESGTGVSSWHNQNILDQNGCNAAAFSRKMYRELTERGWTEVIGFGHGMKPVEPMKFYLIEKIEWNYLLNNREVPLRVLRVGGGFSKDNLKRPKSYSAVEKIVDPSPDYAGTMNRYTILDNPDLPLVLGSRSNFQTKIPGRILSELDGSGVFEAEIEVVNTNSANLSWPSGIFVLPIIEKPFNEFTVRVSHPNFEGWEEIIDFREKESFIKLENITLKPIIRDDAFVWVTPENLDSDLTAVKNSTTRDLVKMELEDNSSLLALVPTSAVPFGMSAQEQAWILFDRESHHMTFVTSEGLHGAVGSVAGQAAQEAQTTVVSAYSGYVSSWYVYSAGRLEALSNEMGGASYSDLGHGHAIDFAKKFLEGMLERMDNIIVQQGGMNNDAYKAGFLKGLEFFESHPEYNGG